MEEITITPQRVFKEPKRYVEVINCVQFHENYIFILIFKSNAFGVFKVEEGIMPQRLFEEPKRLCSGHYLAKQFSLPLYNYTNNFHRG